MTKMNRRTVLKTSVMLTGLGTLGNSAAAAVRAGANGFDYEVTRTDDEWQALLNDDYAILRDGKTEKPKSSLLWSEERAGQYTCKGCDLPQYTSLTKVILDKGWLFFTASEPNAQLMAQDRRAEMMDDDDAFDVFMEVHCRRCGSHMGHILPVDCKALHCINGAALNFEPQDT